MKVHISMGGPTKKIFDTKSSKYWYFEMHNYCGPMLTDKHGNGILGRRQKYDRFWEIVTLWAQQGEKMKDNVCIWD